MTGSYNEHHPVLQWGGSVSIRKIVLEETRTCGRVTSYLEGVQLEKV